MSVTILYPCTQCVEKFISEFGHKPTQGDANNLGKAKKNCICEACYREWAFDFAGIKPPLEYPTLTEAFNSIYI